MNNKSAFPFWGEIDWLNNLATPNAQPPWFPFDQWLGTNHGASPFHFADHLQPNAASASKYWNFYQQLLQHAQSFYVMGKQFEGFVKTLSDTDKKTDGWQKILNEYFDTMKTAVEKSVLSGQGTYITSPFMADTGQEYFRVMGMTPLVDKLLSVPGFGCDREAQADMQKSIQLWHECRKNFNEFSLEMSQVTVEALEDMRLKIFDMAAQNKEITSLREIYDLWIACSEESYAQHVHTDSYAKLYGRLTNALLSLKCHNGKVLDKHLEKWGLPTRQGLRTVAKRTQELKREQVKLIEKIGTLEADIKALKQPLKTAKQSSSSKQVVATKKNKKKRAKKKRIAKRATKKVGKKLRGKKMVIAV